MNRLRHALVIAAGLAGSFAAPAFAADVVLTSDVKVDRVVVQNGEKKHVLLAPTHVTPGENLIFSTQYRNTGAKPATNFTVTNPVPAAVRLSDDGYGSFDVSVDGGKTWGKLAALTVTDAKGAKRPAQSADVTHLRWVLASIAPGAAGSLEYHGIVR